MKIVTSESLPSGALFRGPKLHRPCLAAVVAWSIAAASTAAFADESDEVKLPPLDELVTLNGEALFGQTVTAKDGRVHLKFPPKGVFGKGFSVKAARSRGFLSDPADFKLVTVKDLVHEIQAKAAFAAVATGAALSRFELGDDFKITFRLRAPTLGRSAQMTMRLNQQGRKAYIQTNFFQDLLAVGDRKKKRARATAVSGHPSTWFNRKDKHGVPVEIVFKDKKFSVSMDVQPTGKDKPEKVELVALEGIEKPASGRIYWTFKNMSFAVTDLSIEGKYGREWAQGEIEKLKKRDELVVAKPAPAKPNPDAGAGKEAAPAGKKPSDAAKPGGVDLDKPDPEAEEDL